MYYVQGETMEVIAHHLGVSRSTVSRLLDRARATGIVRIELTQPGGAGSIEGRFASLFGVRAQIVPVREGATEIHRLQQVAGVAAARMVELAAELAERRDAEAPSAPAGTGAEAAGAEELGEGGGGGRGGSAGAPSPGGAEGALGAGGRGVVVGVAWGTTMSEVSAALPARQVPGVTVVQLNGATDPMEMGPSAGEVLSRVGHALGARVVAFPVPAFFDHVATREAMWSERSVRRVLALARSADLAVFGVGSVVQGVLPSQVYEGGHVSRAGRVALRRERVVGDVCTVLLRADGSWSDIALNARATGPTPAQLARIPRRLCVVAGRAKAPALLAALRARVATDLVVDDATARAVLDLASAS